jgi:hypothetical protein
MFAVLTAISWALRPASRRLATQTTEGSKRGRKIGFWVCTIIVAFSMISGGIAELAGAKSTIDGIIVLGYPAYFPRIIGFWKVLGGMCIVLPRLTVPKEWAYAGIFFNMTGAAVSNALCGTAAWHVPVNLTLAALAVASWALRPSIAGLSTKA